MQAAELLLLIRPVYLLTQTLRQLSVGAHRLFVTIRLQIPLRQPVAVEQVLILISGTTVQEASAEPLQALMRRATLLHLIHTIVR